MAVGSLDQAVAVERMDGRTRDAFSGRAGTFPRGWGVEMEHPSLWVASVPFVVKMNLFQLPFKWSRIGFLGEVLRAAA